MQDNLHTKSLAPLKVEASSHAYEGTTESELDWEHLPCNGWFVSLALGVRGDSTDELQRNAMDPVLLAFQDAGLEKAWWHKYTASDVQTSDRNDTIIFTIGTLVTLVRLWYIQALRTDHSYSHDFYILILAALASLSSSIWFVYLSNKCHGRNTYPASRQLWALWTRIARCTFSCVTTPLLFVSSPDSASLTLSLVQALLTTGFIPLQCQQGICMRYKEHIWTQFFGVLLFMHYSHRNCAIYYTDSYAGSLLTKASASLSGILGLPHTALFGEISLCEWLHYLVQVVVGFGLTSYKLYHQEVRARAKFLISAAGITGKKYWPVMGISSPCSSAANSSVASNRSSLDVPH